MVDDGGAQAVFTEQGASASQASAAQFWVRCPDYQGRQVKLSTNLSVHTSTNGKCIRLLKLPHMSARRSGPDHPRTR